MATLVELTAMVTVLGLLAILSRNTCSRPAKTAAPTVDFSSSFGGGMRRGLLLRHVIIDIITIVTCQRILGADLVVRSFLIHLLSHVLRGGLLHD